MSKFHPIFTYLRATHTVLMPCLNVLLVKMNGWKKKENFDKDENQ